MPGGAVTGGLPDATALEAPVTMKAYLMCAFASFGGILFGFDSGYINGVLSMPWFIHTFDHLVSRAGNNLTSVADFFLPPATQHPAGQFCYEILATEFDRVHSLLWYLLRCLDRW